MTKRALISLLALLLAVPAAAQPLTMPPNTVFGRLGISSGPGQAIPIFPNLQVLLAGGETDVADANYPVVAADRNIVYTSLSAARTVTLLPAAAYQAGATITIMDRSGAASSALSISIAPTGADTINGANATIAAIENPYAAVTLETDGTKWTLRQSPLLGLPNTWTGDQYFKTGRPWVDVRAYGAKGDGSTDDAAAIQAAINAAPGGTVYFPPGNYCVKTAGGITVATAGLWLVGPSNANGMLIQTCGADLNLLTINADSVVVRSMSMLGSGLNASANHNVITVGPNGTRTQIVQVDLAGGYYNIANNAAYIFIDHIRTGNAHGPAVIDNVTSGGSSPGFFMRDSQVDHSWPVSAPSGLSSISAWQSAHSYSSGSVVSTNGYYIQATGNCTSGGSAPTLLDYGNNITDNNCIWKLAAPTVFDAVLLDTGSVNVDIQTSDFTGAYTNGVHLMNSLSGTGPISVVLRDMNTWGNNIKAGVNVESGNIINIHDGQMQSGALTSTVGIWLQSGFTGHYVINNMLMFGLGTGSNGILDQANASTGGTIADNRLYNSGTGISVGANINNRTIIGNHAGSSPSLGTNSACIFVSPGTGDYLNIIGNDCNGASSSSVTVTSVTGTHNWIVNPGNATPSASLALMFPTPTRAGDISYWNGTIWTSLAGNNSGTNCLQENSSGVPSFAACSGTITAGSSATSGITSGNFISSTSNLVADSGKAVPTGAVVGTSDSQILTNKSISGSSNTLTSIPNSALVNPSTTVAGQTCTLGSTCLTAPQAQAFVALSQIILSATNVNFNSVADTQFNITLPTGYTRYRIASVAIEGASTSLSSSSVAAFSAAGGTGTTLISATAVTVSTSSDGTTNNFQAIAGNGAATYTASGFPTLFFRVTVAEGSAATANVVLTIFPLP